MPEELTKAELLELNAEMKEALHDVDRYCNQVRSNYRQGSQEEIISSTIKLKIRKFLRT